MAPLLGPLGGHIDQIGIVVADLEAAMDASAALTSLGCRSVLEGEIRELGHFAYFDAPAMHCIVEALELASSFPLFLVEHAAPYKAVTA